MLILTRRANEAIVIGDHIRVTVLRSEHSHGSSQSVRLGITAPKDVRILREEVKLRDEADERDDPSGG